MATKFKLNDCVPCIAIHPGEIIKDELDAREMKQKELASFMGMPTSVLNDIIKGRRAITPEVAVLLQEILSIDASYWLSVQNQYDINIFSWKHYVFYESSKIQCDTKFSNDNLNNLIDELNHLFVINKDTIDTTKKILSRYGIKFIIVPKFDKTPIDGFSFWQGENPTIVLTLRLNRIDNYAFALLHEIYHVYMHLFNNREQKYISIEGAEINKCEEEANKFAKYSLISKDLWSAFLKQHSMISPHAMQMKIKQFAHQHNINEAIVLGFYQHDINLYSIKSSISREIK